MKVTVFVLVCSKRHVVVFACYFIVFFIELGNMLSENVNLSPRANLTMSFTIELNVHDYANLSNCSQI